MLRFFSSMYLRFTVTAFASFTSDLARTLSRCRLERRSCSCLERHLPFLPATPTLREWVQPTFRAFPLRCAWCCRCVLHFPFLLAFEMVLE